MRMCMHDPAILAKLLNEERKRKGFPAREGLTVWSQSYSSKIAYEPFAIHTQYIGNPLIILKPRYLLNLSYTIS